MKSLCKDPKGAMIGGVLNGIAQYLNIDPFLVRIIYVILTLATSWLAGIVIYLLLWYFLPTKEDTGFTDYEIK